MVKKGSGHRADGMRAPVSDILPAPFPCMLTWNLKEAKSYEKMRKTLSLILALMLAFSLAAVPAFAADTEAESSTSDTAYGQLHNGLLSEILSQIDITNDDNFIHGIVGVNIKDLVDHIGSDSNFTHGIVRVTVGDLFKNIASNSNYTHGIVTVVDNRININFGLAFQNAQQQDASGETARTFLTELLTDAGMTQIQSSGIVNAIAAGTLSDDQASAMVDQLAATGKISLTDITTLLGSLTDSGLLDVSTAAQLFRDAAVTVAAALGIQPLQGKGNVSALSHILDSIHIVDGDNFIHGIVSVNINDLVDHIVSNSNFIHGIVGVDVGDLVDHIASDSNFIHGIVNVYVGDLFKDIASNNNYMHGIITITGNTVNINFGQVIGDIAAGGSNSEAAQQAFAEILKAFGMTQTGINAILTGIAGSILTNDQIAQLLSQLISSTNMNLKNVVTIICALYNSRTITLQQAMTLLEKYISQMGGNNSNNGGSTGTQPAQPAGLLDMTSHKAYVSGCTATTFAPTGTLTRAEAAQMLYELMTEQAHKQYDCSSNGFRDVPAGQWYTAAVSTLANACAINGCGDGTFHPNQAISRAQFVTILAGIYGVNASGGMPFSDVGRSWYYDAVATAYANGWVSGLTDGTFHPNQTITRAEAVSILKRVLGRSCDLTFVQANAQTALHFTDVPANAWYYADVIEASVGHTYTELAGIERWTALA